MSFKNVEITKQANVYFDGKVTSRLIKTADGKSKTLGVMLPGSYHFNTDTEELMELTQGACKVKLDGSDERNSYKGGENFMVQANSGFDIEVTELLDYICHF
ncbi:MAG: pyrimidine/purine nucleoside phosphorylase [Chromatiales bacterium]|nr:pyrimidine/purine nucleoside phosphorylase [Chromatiales bacterium]